MRLTGWRSRSMVDRTASRPRSAAPARRIVACHLAPNLAPAFTRPEATRLWPHGRGLRS